MRKLQLSKDTADGIFTKVGNMISMIPLESRIIEIEVVHGVAQLSIFTFSPGGGEG